MRRSVTVETIKPAFSDKRGIITDLLNRPISHVGFITTVKGAVRGSHYHRKSFQYSYILRGVFEVLTASVKSPRKITRHVVKSGDLISLAPGVIHRFRALTKADMVDMISESRSRNAYESDVVRVSILDGVFVLAARS
jgi:dTDP-4-dehydrorhamnose 3,5-epimerase